MKTHWKKTFNKDYLGAHDLDDVQELKVIIKEVRVVSVKDPQGKDGKCNVAYFNDKTKPMILNVTACKQLKKFTNTNYIEEWKNVPIQIYAKQVKAFGEFTEALRIRDVQPKFDKPKLTESMPAFKKAKETIKSDPTNGLKRVKNVYQISLEVEKQLLA
jgi:hypothetical protein